MDRDAGIAKLAESSRRSAIASGVGLLIVLAALVYGSFKLHDLQREISDTTAQRDSLKTKTEALEASRQSLLEFFDFVTARENVSILDESLDWNNVRRQIVEMPPGKRKDAVFAALLVAWKEVPFTMGQESIGGGFDSPRFLRYVLSIVGIDVRPKPGQRLSDALMSSFTKVDDPRPGDLAFYKGQVGHFGFILISTGQTEESMVGIGTLQGIAPLQITSLGRINTPYYPLEGYYRVKYPDE